MPGTLTHSPGDVVRWLMVSLGLGADPTVTPYGSWPVFQAVEPSGLNVPDNCLTVYDTAGRDGGREQVQGERSEHHGIQVRVRSATHNVGYTKARALAVAFDQTVYQNNVTISSQRYLVHCLTRTSDVLYIGFEAPTSKRTIFTINAVAALWQG